MNYKLILNTLMVSLLVIVGIMVIATMVKVANERVMLRTELTQAQKEIKWLREDVKAIQKRIEWKYGRK